MYGAPTRARARSTYGSSRISRRAEAATGLLLLFVIPTLSPAQNVSFAEYKIPIGNGGIPRGITKGPDGAVWFTGAGVSQIGRISAQGAITEYTFPMGTQSGVIVAGPDGNLYFSVSMGNFIGRITPREPSQSSLFRTSAQATR